MSRVQKKIYKIPKKKGGIKKKTLHKKFSAIRKVSTKKKSKSKSIKKNIKPAGNKKTPIIRSVSIKTKPADPGKTTITKKPKSRVHDRIIDSMKKNKKLDKPILIVSGEHSGDLLGAELVGALKQHGIHDFYGTGGDAMQEANVEIFQHIRFMNVIGFIEAIKAYKELKRLADQIVIEAEKRKTKIAILIDYPGFNLRLAEMLKEKKIQVIYLVSPQLWAWKYNRINKIRQVVDLMLPLFPFEEDLYTKENIKARSIGHPMVSRIPKKMHTEDALTQLSSRYKYTIGLIPGSRRGEVYRMLPAMLDSAKMLTERFGKIRFLLPSADDDLLPVIEEIVKEYEGLKVEILRNSTYQIMKFSDAIIITSGTATLEAAFFKTPMVLLYKVGWLNFFLASVLMRVRFIGIVNILGRTHTLVELLQTEVTGQNIFHEIEKILTDKNYHEKMQHELSYVRKQLGFGNPARKAAQEIMNFLSFG